MADFPALTAAARPLTPGRWGGVTHSAMNGQVSTIRTSSAEIGRRLSLRFPAITEAQFLQIVAHYRGQRSGFDGFAFTTTTIPASYTPSGHQWLYVGMPRVVDQHDDVFDVDCDFRSEPRGVFRVPGKAFTVQPALSVAGVLPIINGGAFARTPILTAGVPTSILSGLAITPVGTFNPGAVTAIIGGTAFSVGGGTQDDTVQLLLHGDGANNSTSFTDSSNAAQAITANGGVKISTDQSKFGGGSIYCDGTGDFLSFTAISIGTSDDCTLEAWIYPTSTGDRGIFGHSNSSVNMQPLTLLSNLLQAYWDGTFLVGSTVTANTWTHVAITRSGGTLRLFQDGTLTATSSSNTKAVALDRVGRTQFRGDFVGWIDEARVTVGLARYTATFTAPTAPFPDGAIGAALSFAPGAPV